VARVGRGRQYATTLTIDDPDLGLVAQGFADATGVSVEEALRAALAAKHAGDIRTGSPRYRFWTTARSTKMFYNEYGLPK